MALLRNMRTLKCSSRNMSFVINKDATFTWVGYEFLLIGGGSFLQLEYFKRGKKPDEDNENCHCFTVAMTILCFFLDLTQAFPSPGGLFWLSMRTEMSFFCVPGALCTDCHPSLPAVHCTEAICLHICARRRWSGQESCLTFTW